MEDQTDEEADEEDESPNTEEEVKEFDKLGADDEVKECDKKLDDMIEAAQDKDEEDKE